MIKTNVKVRGSTNTIRNKYSIKKSSQLVGRVKREKLFLLVRERLSFVANLWFTHCTTSQLVLPTLHTALL